MATIKLSNTTNSPLFIPGFYIEIPALETVSVDADVLDIVQNGRLQQLINSGSVLASFAGGAVGEPTRGSLVKTHIYLDGEGGDDSNPGTKSRPIATLTEAELRVTDKVGHATYIHAKAGSANYSISTWKPRLYHGWAVIICDWGGDEDDGFTTIDSGTAQAGSSQTQIVTGGGLGSSNEHRGRTVLVESGDAAGNRKYIGNHTDTDINTTHGYTAAVQAGDLWRIVEPGATLEPTQDHVLYGGAPSPADPTSLIIKPVGGLLIVNFKMSDATVNELRISGAVVMYGIEFDGGAWEFHGFDGHMFAGRDDRFQSDSDTAARLPVELLGVDDPEAWLGWGWSHRSSFVQIFSARGVHLEGLVADRLPVNSGVVDVNGCELWNLGARILGGTSAAPGPYVRINASDVKDIKIGAKIKGSFWGVRCGGGELHILGSGTQITASGSPAVWSELEGFVYVQEAEIVDSDIGFLVEKGGVIYFHEGNTTITKADTAETQVNDAGTLNNQLKSAYTSTGDYFAAGDGSKIQRVF